MFTRTEKRHVKRLLRNIETSLDSAKSNVDAESLDAEDLEMVIDELESLMATAGSAKSRVVAALDRSEKESRV